MNNISNNKLFHLMARNHAMLLATNNLILNLTDYLNPDQSIAEKFESYQSRVEINVRQLYEHYGFEYEDFDKPELSDLTDTDIE